MNQELIERLRGTDRDALTCVDRLRLYEHDPKTFDFSVEDAEGVLAIVDEAANALEGGVTVKPLGEWRRGYCDEAVTIEQASTGFGSVYQVRVFENAVWLDSPVHEKEEHPSVDAAKAAAQADYDRRIRSALSAPAQRVEDGTDIEAKAWNCDEWPDWLHAIVDHTNEVADRLDMSSEQAHAYAVLHMLAASPAPAPHAGVDDAMVERALETFDSEWQRQDSDFKEHYRKNMRAALRAALEDRT